MQDAASDPLVEPIRDASRRLVRELGFMGSGLAGTRLPPSAVHALLEIGQRGPVLSAALCESLRLDKSSVSRMVRKLVRAGDVAMTPGERGKPLSLTPRGRATLAAIDRFARDQVGGALALLPAQRRRGVLDGLATYAEALHASRAGQPGRDAAGIEILFGYRPGVIGRATELHARYYDRSVGFGQYFESKVAAGLAEFAGRLAAPRNGLWAAVQAGEVVGTIAIDGEDLGADRAHLRWFIVDDRLHGHGIGRRLLAEAIAFCDRRRFARTELWTFRGLDAARRLYEEAGFRLAEEFLGRQWGDEVVEQHFARVANQSR